ncbi:MAG: A/G-specific adenine glycosylase [Armatimonadota bacterium]|nr:A/G-specific adenine glycosylase [Armatimonadota bacterium]
MELAARRPSRQRRRTTRAANREPLHDFDRAAFARRLVRWFHRAQRDLPWRRPENVRDPYRVLVSEIMLQQTTVAAAAPYYERFIARFPTLQSLAAASIEEVLPLWAGLGYYQRVRNLHACARAVMEQYHGEFPRELDAVQALPGIGRYTAGAVTSIAFDVPAPIVDANIARVFARIFCLTGDVKAPANQRRLWQEAERLIAACASKTAADCRPSVVNPALMELGALVCVPRAPRCPVCPVKEFCAAHAAGLQNELPHAAPKPQVKEQHDACAFIRRTNAAGDEEILLRQRPHEAKIWWRGMWELPRVTAKADESGEAALRRCLRDELGLEGHVGAHLKSLRHSVTHHQITLDCWVVELEDHQSVPPGAQWYEWHELERLAIPSPMRRLLAWLRAHPILNLEYGLRPQNPPPTGRG